MSTNLQDYVELLNAEQHVQVNKLREHARHGVSPRVRGEVWMYLLDVLSSDKTSEITSLISLNSSYQSLPSRLPSNLTSLILKTALAHHTHRFFNPTYAGLISSITSKPPSSRESSGMIPTIQDTRNPPAFAIPPCESEDTLTLRSQYVRFLPPPPSSPPARDEYLMMVEEVLGKFWSTEKDKGRDEEWRRTGSGGMDGTERDWVYLVTPFVCCLTRPMAVFLGFQRLVERLEGFPSMPSRLASLLTLFRLTLPELWSYFGDEQVPYVQIAMSWLQTMLAKEMWLGDVLRLWDAYLASDDMFALHCYVCVAILSTCKETLEELDGSEAKLMLLDLPPMDVDRLLQDAANLRVSFALPRPTLEQHELDTSWSEKVMRAVYMTLSCESRRAMRNNEDQFWFGTYHRGFGRDTQLEIS